MIEIKSDEHFVHHHAIARQGQKHAFECQEMLADVLTYIDRQWFPGFGDASIIRQDKIDELRIWELVHIAARKLSL